MKKSIITLVCLSLTSLAFAQPSADKKQNTTEGVTVTGAAIKMTSQDGAACSYQPMKTLVIREDNANPNRYVLNGAGHVLDKSGQAIQTAIKPGTRVRVYYANMGDLRMIDHVVVID